MNVRHAAAALAVLTGALAAQHTPPPAPAAVPVTPSAPVLVEADRIEEDEPGWDCETMGNRQCGPTPAMTAWQACMAEYTADPSGVTPSEAAAECDEESGHTPEDIR